MKLNEREVNAEIAFRESSELNRSILQDLANLYVVRDHFFGAQGHGRSYSQASAPEPKDTIGVYGESDFLKAVSDKDESSVWAIMDELMDTLHVVNPRVYDSVLRKIEKA